jgi:thioredoxin-dependent peroxiredoxin
MIADMANLSPGDAMPDTTLIGPEGPLKLRERIGKPLVVYFYPKDETYGCTKEACGFRDQYEAFVAAGADVIGISRDDAQSHEKFREHHRLPFTLLSDPGGSVAARWGVRNKLGFIPGRVTFVFDKSGVVRHRFESMLQFGKHVDEALEVIKTLG